MSNRLHGKIAIITGATQGQGVEEARAFVEAGATVVLTDIDDRGAEVAAPLGDSATFIHLDVADEAGWDEVVRRTVEMFGGIDILVNNAGVMELDSLQDSTPEQFDRVMAVNLRGPYLGMRAVVPHMKARGGGAIINICSAAGMTGQPDALVYSTAKWGLRGMSKSAALDLGADGIRVVSVHPGTIATRMVAEQGVVEGGDLPYAALGRPGIASDVAAVVTFLASDEAAYITGTEIAVDGGSSAGVTDQVRRIVGRSSGVED